MHIKAIEEVLARAMNKHFQFSNYIMLLKTVIPLCYQRSIGTMLTMPKIYSTFEKQIRRQVT